MKMNDVWAKVEEWRWVDEMMKVLLGHVE